MASPHHDFASTDHLGVEAVAAFVDHLSLFAMGFSWGGYESLCLPVRLGQARTVMPWAGKGNLFRLHIGFEDVAELKGDLAAGLDRYTRAR